jgi:hypothetical protein
MTITLPQRIEEALTREARKFDQAAPEYLKSMLFAACQSPTGVLLKLEMPPLVADPAQPLLPLGGGDGQ